MSDTGAGAESAVGKLAPAISAWLGLDEPPAVEVVNPGGRGSAVLICDHASHRLPRRLGTLGLDETQRMDHIAWDPGAAQVARRLSLLLDAPLLLSGYSRLVIDCNRPLCSPESIPERSAGVRVPGNLALPSTERNARVEALFRPYHEAIDRLLDSRCGHPSLLLSIHSFTPALNGHPRPWHVGISSGRDRRFADLIRAALMRDRRLAVGDNEPYPIENHIDYSIPVHGEERGLPSIMVEIRQDGVRTAAGAADWAERLAAAYLAVEAQALHLRAPARSGD